MVWISQYERWNLHSHLDQQLKIKLDELRKDQLALEDAFYKNLDFGTAGMRGLIGPGTNRMNIYTVRKAAKGLGKLICEKGKIAMDRGVAISYDNRKFSREFALESAKVLGADGIRVYVFAELRPTPELSFAVRQLHTYAGIMITASHNPPQYNGFKVYGEDGGQLVGSDSEKLLYYVNQIENELDIEKKEIDQLENEALLSFIGKEMDDMYEEQLMTVIQNKQLVREKGGDLKVVFTPLHGAAKVSILNSFQKAGFDRIQIVASQATADENFTNVSSANPEEHIAFDRAIEEGKKVDADILIATDPDGDRVGIAAKDNDGQYKVLTGNETGALMLHYLMSYMSQTDRRPRNGVMIQSIVSSPLGKEIAQDFNVEAEEVLTGFKYIAEKINQYEEDHSKEFIFGYEESYGYLIKPFVRDKDAIQAALLAAETALFYKGKNISLFEALHHLHEIYGYYFETIRSFVFEGKKGLELMQTFIDSFRQSIYTPEGFQLERVEDYLSRQTLYLESGEKVDIALPAANVLKYVMTDGSWFCLRPSGTEPKLKLYFGVKGSSKADARSKLEKLITPLTKKVEDIQV